MAIALTAVHSLWARPAVTVAAAKDDWGRGGARAHYDRRKAAGDRHAAAQRNLFARLLSCLHHCLATGQHYNEATAFPTATQATPAKAA